MAITLIFSPIGSFSSETQNRFAEKIENLIINFWEPYIFCPWKKIFITKFDTHVPGSIRIHIPFVTLLNTPGSENSLQIDNIFNLMIKYRIFDYHLSMVNPLPEYNTNFLVINNSVQRGYKYPNSYLDDLKKFEANREEAKKEELKQTELKVQDIVKKGKIKDEDLKGEKKISLSQKESGGLIGLSIEMLILIYCFLNSSSFFLISSQFRDISKSKGFWKRLLFQNFPNMFYASTLLHCSEVNSKELFGVLTSLNRSFIDPFFFPHITPRFISYGHKVNELITVSSNSALAPLLYFIKGILYVHNLVNDSSEICNDSMCLNPPKKQSAEYAYENFKLSVESQPMLSVAMSMYTFIHREFFEKNTKPSAKSAFMKNLERSFRLTLDPVAAFDLGYYYILLGQDSVELKDYCRNKSRFWLWKALELGLENYGQFPLIDQPRKLLCLQFLANEYPEGSNERFNFYKKNKAYTLIYAEWQKFQQNQVIGFGKDGRKKFLDKLVIKIRDEKSISQAQEYAQALCDYFLFRNEFDPLSKTFEGDWLTRIEIQAYFSENIKKINSFTEKDRKIGFNQYTLLGNTVYKCKQAGIKKEKIDKELKELTDRQIKKKKPISWTIVTIDNQYCARMNLSVKEENQKWFKDNLSFPISFVKKEAETNYHLVIHGVDKESFEKFAEGNQTFTL